LVLTSTGIEGPRGWTRAGREWLVANFENVEETRRRAGGYEFAGETRFDRLFAGSPHLIGRGPSAMGATYAGSRTSLLTTHSITTTVAC
jgi:hypothetical protein